MVRKATRLPAAGTSVEQIMLERMANGGAGRESPTNANARHRASRTAAAAPRTTRLHLGVSQSSGLLLIATRMT